MEAFRFGFSCTNVAAFQNESSSSNIGALPICRDKLLADFIRSMSSREKLSISFGASFADLPRRDNLADLSSPRIDDEIERFVRGAERLESFFAIINPCIWCF